MTENPLDTPEMKKEIEELQQNTDTKLHDFAKKELAHTLERALIYQIPLTEIAEVIKETLGEDAAIIKNNL